jgi:GNAT superfamily N-acetyltransferase
MHVTTRPVEAQDFDRWDTLWCGYLAYYETERPADVRRIAFDKLMDGTSRLHGRLALVDDEPVGLVHYIFHDHMWRPEGVCYLQDLFADPNYRGGGVGRALITSVYEAADAVGIPRVYWLTQDFNHTARKLYDKVARLSPFIKYDRVL